MKALLAVSVLFAASLTVQSASAQAFFGGGVVAYDPEISTVSSGVVTDIQPTVSYDRKYVTIGMQVQDSRLIALRNFQVANPLNSGPAQGFVGNAAPTGISFSPTSSSPEEIERRAAALRSILSRQGMFLLRVN